MNKPLHDPTRFPVKIDKIAEFEQIVLPHLDAAYNLARWLTRNDHDAEDLVQLAFVRALQYFDSFQGGNARAWLMTIVRHAFYNTLRDAPEQAVDFDENEHGTEHHNSANPEARLRQRELQRGVGDALQRLPNNFREVVILKEMEQLSYKEIADLAGIPIGTVMSRLARGRKMLLDLMQGAGMRGTDGM